LKVNIHDTEVMFQFGKTPVLTP